MAAKPAHRLIGAGNKWPDATALLTIQMKRNSRRSFQVTPSSQSHISSEPTNGSPSGLLVDELSDFHFLGAIIVHGRRSNPSEPNIYEVIDGQQRITTIFLYLCAIVRVLSKKAEYAEASGLFQKYLVIARQTALVSNSKLHSGKDDRAQINFVFNDLLSDTGFSERVAPFKYKPLPTTSSDTGRLRTNYRCGCPVFRRPGR